MTNQIRIQILFGASAIALATSPAVAQDTPTQAVEDDTQIVVTATKRETSLLEVPFSINAQTEADIQRSGANTIEDLSRNVAGLTIQNLGPGQSQVSVRGVSSGQIVRDQPGVKEQVGVYLDESVISLSLFTPDLDLFDLNRVETLRDKSSIVVAPDRWMSSSVCALIEKGTSWTVEARLVAVTMMTSP